MNLILASAADSAALNLRERLLELGDWHEDGEFQGTPTWRLANGDGFCSAGTRMATLRELHLYAEHVDHEWEELTGEAPECIAFLSRHKSASGRPSLTVHPVGNWGAADYGGTPGAVSGTAPEWMTGLLLAISRTAPAGYQVCFEATHHGPLLETPAFFVEIGSDESRWELREPAEVLARALLELKQASGTPLWALAAATTRRASAMLHCFAKHASATWSRNMRLSTSRRNCCGQRWSIPAHGQSTFTARECQNRRSRTGGSGRRRKTSRSSARRNCQNVPEFVRDFQEDQYINKNSSLAAAS